jgi:arginine utilization protein RocB
MEAHDTRNRSRNVLMIDQADEECEHGGMLHQNHKLECIDQTGIDTTDTHTSWNSL